MPTSGIAVREALATAADGTPSFDQVRPPSRHEDGLSSLRRDRKELANSAELCE